MYLSANNGGGSHTWRQPFPNGRPEQITSGATEEQGLSVAPDGRSFVTSIGERQSTLWLHAADTRQVTFEGFVYTPTFSVDGKRLYYLQRSRQDRRFVSGELWRIDVSTGKPERLLANELMESYDVSRDESRVVFVRVDGSGQSSIWEAAINGQFAPRRLSTLPGVRVLFGPGDDVFFVGGEPTNLALYRVSKDGQSQKIVPRAVYLYDTSPDGKWVAAWVDAAVGFYPVDGGAPRVLCKTCATAGDENRGVTPPLVRWSRGGKYLYLHSTLTKRTYVLTLHDRVPVPDLPADGFVGIGAAAERLGAQPLADDRAFVSDDPTLYAFPRVSTHRNIYRVSVP
jgi:Tol biopolymer transport system component